MVLSALNGLNPDGVTSYLPKIGTNHGNDTVVNYEPVVAPIAAGGYAWVIFTSRRLYGNLATQDPLAQRPTQLRRQQVRQHHAQEALGLPPSI